MAWFDIEPTGRWHRRLKEEKHGARWKRGRLAVRGKNET